MEHGGFTDFEWVIREDHVEEYEADDLPFNVYPLDFVDEYAPAHWRHPTAEYERGAFAGAFSGREWAMGTAEERGYDMVLQDG